MRLLPPSYVKAYLKRSKNDANDAAAICEAVTRPSMRFVATKSEQQQSGLMLHRSRQLLVCQRTMLSNAIRGHMAELGIISAKGRNGTAELLKIIANEQDDRIPVAARFSLDILARQYAAIRAEIAAIEKRIHAWHRSSEETGDWRKSPGLARSSPPPSWPRWEIGRCSRRAAVSRRGSAWCRDNIRPGAKRGSAGSQSRAIDICAGCLSPVRWLSSDMLASTERSDPGSLV